MSEVTLSLISHTNVGKTTLARTLLRRDVGESFDQSHVTDRNEAYPLIERDGEALVLWDTPGFGDSARLLKRLKGSENPLVWVLSQVWDRIADRPLWCSQQAVRNVKEDADVVLYLANASEDPAQAGYVDLELELLAWIGKPVVILLNQTGGGRGGGVEEEDEKRWEAYTERWEMVRGVLGLDAFARCWVQEGELMGVIEEVLEGERAVRFNRLREAWEEQHLDVFEGSVRVVAEQLGAAVGDSEAVEPETFVQKLGVGRMERNRDLARAREALAGRFTERSREAMNALIRLHQLEGQTAEKMAAHSREQFDVPTEVNESVWGAVGGAATGALTGLVAELKAGGLLFGGGVVAGGILGGLGAYGLAKGYNLAKGRGQRVRWSLEHFLAQVELAALCYLAVAHFGRGRGAWEDGETPKAWQEAAKRAIDGRRGQFERIWKRAGGEKVGDGTEENSDQIAPLIGDALVAVLEGLYPGVRVPTPRV